MKTKDGQEKNWTVSIGRIFLETNTSFSKNGSVAYLKSELDKMVTGISEIREEGMLKKTEENSDRVCRLV